MALVRDDDGNWYDDGSDDSGNFNNFTGVSDFIPDEPAPFSWEDEYNKLIGGGSKPNETTFNNIFSPSNAEILKNINFDARSDITNAINKALGTNYTGKQLAAMAAVAGGGFAGFSGAMNPNTTKIGYQGSIPKYDAVRNMITAPPTRAQGYRPGQGGINYGGDVSYVPRGTRVSAAQPSQAVNRAPADMAGTGLTGISGPLTGIMAGLADNNPQNIAPQKLFHQLPAMLSPFMPASGFAQGGLMKLAQGGALGQQTVKNDDPFFSSPEFKALQNSVAKMPATSDAYLSPYFGQISSGSIGKALDEAYKQYQKNTKGGIVGGDGYGVGSTNIGANTGPDVTTTGQFGQLANALGMYSLGANVMGNFFGANKDATTNPNVAVVDLSPAGQAEMAASNAAAGLAVAGDAEAAAAEAAANAAADMSGMGGGGDTSGGDFSGGYGGDAGYGAATGGMVPSGLMRLAKGRYLQGETDGMADKIPAQIGQDQPAALSHGEFVVPADVVSHLGNGNSDAGAKKLYQMMDKIRTARTGNKKQGKQINPDKFMPGGKVQRLNTGGTAGASDLAKAAAVGATGMEQSPNTWAGEYMSDMLGKGQALANAPYQQYMGPLTAGESGLQSKVFGGLQSANFPSNLGQSFSSAGAYQPPAMNMGAYQQRPIGTGQGAAISQDATGMPQYGEIAKIKNYPQPDPIMPIQLAGSMGQPGQMPQGGLAGLAGQPGQMPQGGLIGLLGGMRQYGEFPTPDAMPTVGGDDGQPIMPIQLAGSMGQPDPIMPVSRMGDYRQPDPIMPVSGQPGQMPQGSLAGLLGGMRQPQQQTSSIASQYMNPYLQNVLTPQMEELRRQAQINNLSGLGSLTKSGAFGGGRQAIMESEAARNLLQEQNKALGQGYASAFDKAQQQFNTEQAQGMGLANLMSTQGAQQRGIEAEGIAADKAAFEQARENPYKMLQFQQSMLQGMPISATNYNLSTPSALVGGAQGATTTYNLLKNLGLV
jgi:hypothetical protein